MKESRLPIRSTKQLGDAIKRFRKAEAYSQDDLAKSSGLRQAGISHLEAGAEGVRLGTFFKILAALDLEIVLRKREKAHLG
jgi:HTH-type transcriptional regulator / antitoxin HipB